MSNEYKEALEMHAKEEMERYKRIETEIQELHKTVQDLVDIWKQTQGALHALKILAACVVGLTASWVFIKDNLTIMVK